MKQLYKLEIYCYVMAEDELEAQDIRIRHLGACSRFAIEAETVHPDWLDTIPFNSDDDRTCGQILEAQEKEEAKE